VWSWDITYLKSIIRGHFFYLYLVVDVFSRKIVGFSLHDRECPDLAAALVQRACTAEGIESGQLVIHMDNGGPMKGATFHATLERLGVAASYSRPSVSDDNPYSESLFRTLKYRPNYPELPFASMLGALQWVERFVHWYNNVHLHSAIRFVTPALRHAGGDLVLLAQRKHVYEAARAAHPERWSRTTRDWSRIAAVELNPARPSSDQTANSVA